MAYEPLNVTAGKGDTMRGPIWARKEALTADLEIGFQPTAEDGWVRLGEGSTEGIDVSQEADSSDKAVWGAKILGTKTTNFKDTITARLASSTDPDVLAFIYGAENVVQTTGGLKVNVTNRQPSVWTVLFQMTTDDGRARDLVIPRASVDVNLSATFSDEDIVVYEVSLVALEDAAKRTHYELLATVPVAETP